jgi:hypothetical protein
MKGQRVWVVGAAAVGVMAMAMGALGCAGGMGQSGTRAAEFDPRVQPSLRIGGSTLIDARLSPLVPVDVKSDGVAINVRFGERGRTQAAASLDPLTGRVLSRATGGRSEPAQNAEWGTTRVTLEGGRSIVCWTEQSADGGRRAMARLWAADGHPLGSPVAISSPEADVLGTPRAASVDGRHAVVTFASTSGGSFELRAVALEDPTRSLVAESTAAR